MNRFTMTVTSPDLPSCGAVDTEFVEYTKWDVNDFPELSKCQNETMWQVFSFNDMRAVIVHKFCINITVQDINTLEWEPTARLNDNIINFYMALLNERGSLSGYPKVYAMNTNFFRRLVKDGYSAVKNWTANVDIFACDIIPVPVQGSNAHLSMAIINMKEKTIKYYDSKRRRNLEVIMTLENYLREASVEKKNTNFDFKGWMKGRVQLPSIDPKQQNDADCGVFSCMIAEFICRQRHITFDQQDMKYFRQRMILEIYTGEMML